MKRKRTPTLQERRTYTKIDDIAKDHELYFHWSPWLEVNNWDWSYWDMPDCYPGGCTSCFPWCPTCIWNWHHYGQPEKPCEVTYSGVYGPECSPEYVGKTWESTCGNDRPIWDPWHLDDWKDWTNRLSL